MSILLTTALIGCGVLVGRLIARGTTVAPKKAPKESLEEPNEENVKPPHEPKDDPKPRATPIDWTAFPFELGDVVLRSMGEEAWLAGALVMREGGDAAAVIFFSPEAGGDLAVFARPASQEILWLVPAKDAVVSGEPPTALEAGGDRFERRRRLPLRAERAGTGAPDVSGDVILAEYTGLGDDHLVVVATKERALVYRGPALSSGAYDVLPGEREKN
jgi:hypothetical protein